MAHRGGTTAGVHQRRNRPAMNDAGFRVADKARVIGHLDFRRALAHIRQPHTQGVGMRDRAYELFGYLLFVHALLRPEIRHLYGPECAGAARVAVALKEVGQWLRICVTAHMGHPAQPDRRHRIASATPACDPACHKIVQNPCLPCLILRQSESDAT